MVAVPLGMPALRAPRAAGVASPRPARPRPAEPGLVDQHGRIATDLRVSVTDRCNLRCTYCMPPEGLDWIPGDELLSADELVRVVRLAVAEGVTEVRFTGGEPLVRPDVESIIAGAAGLSPAPSISLTTNGIGLTKRAESLRAAGLTRINV